MSRRPPSATLNDTVCPYTTRYDRALRGCCKGALAAGGGFADAGSGCANYPGPVVGAALGAVGVIAIGKRGRRDEPRAEIGVLVILQLLRPDRGHARHKNQQIGRAHV